MSRILARIHDEMNIGPVDEIPNDVYELTVALREFMDAPLRDQLGEVLALHDDNALMFTDAAIEVMVTTMVAMKQCEDGWRFPGSPSVKDVAQAVAEQLFRTYGVSQ